MSRYTIVTSGGRSWDQSNVPLPETTRLRRHGRIRAMDELPWLTRIKTVFYRGLI